MHPSVVRNTSLATMAPWLRGCRQSLEVNLLNMLLKTMKRTRCKSLRQSFQLQHVPSLPDVGPTCCVVLDHRSSRIVPGCHRPENKVKLGRASSPAGEHIPSSSRIDRRQVALSLMAVTDERQPRSSPMDSRDSGSSVGSSSSFGQGRIVSFRSFISVTGCSWPLSGPALSGPHYARLSVAGVVVVLLVEHDGIVRLAAAVLFRLTVCQRRRAVDALDVVQTFHLLERLPKVLVFGVVAQIEQPQQPAVAQEPIICRRKRE
uniref:Uncharacterized protein n=1 Tax=Anopheles coluzzii TaxID=1518534 RepID=A0A8W7P2A9_ANOCL